MSEWIRLAIKLPEENQEVLTHVPGYYNSCVQSLYSKRVHPEFGGWWSSGVTHWMPLPDPPNQST